MYGEGFFEKKFDLSKNPDEVSRFDGNLLLLTPIHFSLQRFCYSYSYFKFNKVFTSYYKM
jgi:hypothetical protein